MLDTLSVAQELTAGSIDRDQAEVIANAMRKLAEQGDHVTADQFKADLAEVRTEIAALDTRLSTQIADLRTRFVARLARGLKGVMDYQQASAGLAAHDVERRQQPAAERRAVGSDHRFLRRRRQTARLTLPHGRLDRLASAENLARLVAVAAVPMPPGDPAAGLGRTHDEPSRPAHRNARLPARSMIAFIVAVVARL
jgi:hypothetical protein